MSPEQIAAMKAEWLAELKAELTKALAPFSATIEAVKTSVEEVKTAVAAVATKHAELAEGYKEDIEEIGAATEKVLERLAAVESIFAAPKSGDGGASEPVADPNKPKNVWAGMIMPKEFAARAAGRK